MNNDIRWKQRYSNFDRAYVLLRQGLERGPSVLSPLEKEGIIQRFEYTFELAWNTLKDFLEEGGIIISPLTPRQVIKEAFAAKILSDGQVWIDMLDHRNRLSHTYDSGVFATAVEAIAARYLPAMTELRQLFRLRAGRRGGPAQMRSPGLAPNEVTMLHAVFRRHPEVRAVKLHGSRAKGTHGPHSDIDLALWGDLDGLRAESIAAELDELPLPYRFDVTSFAAITLHALREHIERVGIAIYPEIVAVGGG